MPVSYRWIKRKEYGVDFTATPVIEMTNGRIKVLAHPESGRVVQILSAAGTAHLISCPARLGKDFRAYGIGEIRYSCDIRGWGYGERWAPLNLESDGWTHEIEQTADGLTVRMVSHPKPDSWGEVVAIVSRSISLSADNDTVAVRTGWRNPLSASINNFHDVWVGATPGYPYGQGDWVGRHNREHLLVDAGNGRVRQYTYWDLKGGGCWLGSQRMLAYDWVDQEGLLVESDCDQVEVHAEPGSMSLFGLTFHGCRWLPRWGEAEMTLRLTPVAGPPAAMPEPFCRFRPPRPPASIRRESADLAKRVREGRKTGRIPDEESCMLRGQLRRADWWKSNGDAHGYRRAVEILVDAKSMIEAVENGARLVSQEPPADAAQRHRKKLTDAERTRLRQEIAEHLAWFDSSGPFRLGSQPWGYMFHASQAIAKAFLMGDRTTMRRGYERYRDNGLAVLEKYLATTLSTVHAVYVGDWFEGSYEKLVAAKRLSRSEREQAWAAYLETVDWMDEAGGCALKTNWGWSERGLLARALWRMPFHPRADLWKRLVQELIADNISGQCDGDGMPAEPISYIGNATSQAVQLDLRMKGISLDKPLPRDYAGGNLYRSYEFFFRASGPDGRVIAIGDGSAVQAADYLAAGARFFGQGQWAQAALDFGYKPPAEESGLPMPPPEPYTRGNDLLRHSGFAIFRKRRTQLTFWYGRLASHAHNDCLSFELWVEGEHLSRDPGCTADGYGSYANQYWVSQARGHNCVTLNDESYTANERPVLTKWEDRGPGDAEFAAAAVVYRDAACQVRLERRVRQQGLTFHFLDSFRGMLPGWAREMVWRFNSPYEPEVKNGVVTIRGKNAAVRIESPDPDMSVRVIENPYRTRDAALAWQIRFARPVGATPAMAVTVAVLPPR